MLPVLFLAANAFYLPGIGPKNYKKGDEIPALVNALTAKESLLPYDFYNSDFNFCKPETPLESKKGSLGSVLFGDRLFSSPFQVTF